MTDFTLAIWTLMAICVGVVIGAMAVVIVDMGDPDDGDDDPEWEPLWPPDDGDRLFLYQLEVAAGHMFEANLLEPR